MPDKPTTNRRQNLYRLGQQLADLLENPEIPHEVEEGIREMLCELGSVAPLTTPTILRAIYPLLVEEAERRGVNLQEPNYVGQDIAANPREYEGSAETVN